MLIKLIEYFVGRLVEDPSSISIKCIEMDGKNIMQILVAPQDLARVIGKEGRVFKALRQLVNAVDSEKTRDVVVDTIS